MTKKKSKKQASSSGKKVKNKKANAGKTNSTKNSLVKVVVLEDIGKWIKPEKESVFYINENAEFPDITFEIETTEAEPYEWSWSIKWDAKVSGVRESAKRGKLVKTFTDSGTADSTGKTWKANLNSKILGGALTVEVKAGNEKFKRTIFIKGKNPSAEMIKAHSDSLDGTKGFDKILMHEALGKNFINADGEPIVSFDKGFGITQMTHPSPSYEQCWSWKENINAGRDIFKEKKKIAMAYLKKEGRGTYNEEQLENEIYSRYNGGSYYVWSNEKKELVRKSLICDTEVANIGWSPSNELNKDKTASELHERDKDEFKTGKGTEEHPWFYTGVCYADHVNSK